MQPELRREDLLAPPVVPRRVPPDLQRRRLVLVLLHGSLWVSHAKQACESLNRQRHAQKGRFSDMTDRHCKKLEIYLDQKRHALAGVFLVLQNVNIPSCLQGKPMSDLPNISMHNRLGHMHCRWLPPSTPRVRASGANTTSRPRRGALWERFSDFAVSTSASWLRDDRVEEQFQKH